jgi:hypothetical protein
LRDSASITAKPPCMAVGKPPATLLCSFALGLVFPTTMASADFSAARAGEICLRPSPLRSGSPGKGTMLPCTTAAFTSTGKPDDFAVLCQLVVPYRRCPHRFAGRLSPLRSGSMRFLFIGSQVSPSLPSPSRSPFPSWLQMVVSSFSCLVFLQGSCTPFTSCPCWAHTSRAVTTPTSRPVSMIFRNNHINTVIDVRPRW